MIDISNELLIISEATLGEQVRDAVVAAMIKIYDNGYNNVDNEPTPLSSHPALSGGIYESIVNSELASDIIELTIDTNWSDTEPFAHVITISEADSISKIDIIYDTSLIEQLVASMTTAIWIENDNGTFSVKALGSRPTSSLVLKCEITDTFT